MNSGTCAIPLTLMLCAASVHAAPCRFNTEPASYEVDSKECRALQSFEALLARLTETAGFKKGEITLSSSIDADRAYDAKFSRLRSSGGVLIQEIILTDGFVRCHSDVPATAADTLAHEVAHAIQLREGARRELVRDEDLIKDRFILRPRYEAQADALGSELLRIAGITPHPSESSDLILSCMKAKADYHSQVTHPSDVTRWVEGVILMERFKKEAQKLGDPRPTMETPSVKPDWNGILRRHDWKRISEDGRGDGAVRGVIKTDVPQPFTADREGRIRLPGGKMWRVPPSYLRYLSPAEIIAYATRGPVPPETIQEGFKRGLEHLMQSQDWAKLPGEVTDQ